jgi:hypothetical protein
MSDKIKIVKVKLLDPEQRETWQHPEDPGFSIEYRAYAGVTLTTDINIVARQYINFGITKVIMNGEAVIEPRGGWSTTLPSDIQTIMFVKISQLSKLTPEEVQDLPSPLGSASTEKNTTATDANGEDGSA